MGKFADYFSAGILIKEFLISITFSVLSAQGLSEGTGRIFVRHIILRYLIMTSFANELNLLLIYFPHDSGIYSSSK